MHSINMEHWPLAIALVTLVFTAWSELRLRRIPNGMVLSLTAAGWLFAAMAGWRVIDAGGTFLGSFAATFVALLVLLPAYRQGLRAGCVKSQMAMGAWIGCAVGPVAAIAVTAVATLAGDVATRLVCQTGLAERFCRAKDVEIGGTQTLLFSAQVTHSLAAAVVLAAYALLV